MGSNQTGKFSEQGTRTGNQYRKPEQGTRIENQDRGQETSTGNQNREPGQRTGNQVRKPVQVRKEKGKGLSCNKAH
jgi:hypothetical protein